MWSKYKIARNEVTSALRRAKASYFTKMFEEVKKTSAYWNLINKATNRTGRSRTIGPLKRDDGSLVLLDKEKAQRMNSYFTAIGENLINSPPMPTQHAPVDENTSLIPESSFALLTNQSVQERVNKLKTNKSSGPDDISPKLLKLAGKAIVPALVDIFNYSIERRTVFSSWKTARLTPILKKDNQADCGNYRPVSLLSVPSKILEAEVNDILIHHVF